MPLALGPYMGISYPHANNRKSALPFLSGRQHLSTLLPSSCVLFIAGLLQSIHKYEGGLATLLWAFGGLLILEPLSQ